MGNVILLMMVLGRETFTFFSTDLSQIIKILSHDSIVTKTNTNFQKNSLCSLI